MMTKRWETIIDSLSVVNQECVNIEKLRQILDYDMEVNSQVLDSLYIYKLISLDEYKDRMERYITHLKDSLKFAEMQLNDAKEKGDMYSPWIYYSYTNLHNRGTAIERASNEDFVKKFSNIE